MQRLLSGFVDADPVTLGVTVGLLVVLAAVYATLAAVRRARAPRERRP
jgi:threonine/homoserine/homoserine lactone efflux protein